MRIMDYPKTTEIVKESTFMNVDSAAAGTKAISMDDLRKSFMDFTTRAEYYEFLDKIEIPWQQRRTIYRGKSLGSVLTQDQKYEISNGRFKNMFIGDYWENNENHWVIADINYWLSKGDTGCYTHHLVIVPKYSVGQNEAMNSTNTTIGGYAGCALKQANISHARSIIHSAFPALNILKHRELFTNAVTNGYPSGGAWYDSDIDLMSELMIYGARQLSPMSNGSIIIYNYTIDKSQLALFHLEPRSIVLSNSIDPSVSSRMAYWLRDVVSASSFAYVASHGYSDYGGASGLLGVRPCFGIVG